MDMDGLKGVDGSDGNPEVKHVIGDRGVCR